MNWWTRCTGFALSAFLAVLSVSANDIASNSAVKLPIIDVTDRVFVPIAAEKELSHAWVGQIVEDSQGFLWLGTRDSLVRYDGYQIRRYSPDSAGANGVFVQECCRYALFRDRSGLDLDWRVRFRLQVRSSEHEQFTTFESRPRSFRDWSEASIRIAPGRCGWRPAGG